MSAKALRVAICGARGIGGVHARIFNALGARVCGVAGTTESSAKDAAGMLKDSFGIEAKPYCGLEALLNEASPDAVSLCTPAQYHFKQILAVLDRDIPVFCEKPFFWHKEITRDEIEENLTRIESHPMRRLFINTCNVSFLDRVIKEIDGERDIKSFSFRFYTQGRHLREAIGLDLLPHGLSFVLRLIGVKTIQDLAKKVSEHNYSCSFSYGGCKVEFDFQELPGGPKELEFSINGDKFTRIQEGFADTYRVYLKDARTGQKIEAYDPFSVYIKRFLDYCDNGAYIGKDDFREASANLRLMSNILL